MPVAAAIRDARPGLEGSLYHETHLLFSSGACRFAFQDSAFLAFSPSQGSSSWWGSNEEEAHSSSVYIDTSWWNSRGGDARPLRTVASLMLLPAATNENQLKINHRVPPVVFESALFSHVKRLLRNDSSSCLEHGYHQAGIHSNAFLEFQRAMALVNPARTLRDLCPEHASIVQRILAVFQRSTQQEQSDHHLDAGDSLLLLVSSYLTLHLRAEFSFPIAFLLDHASFPDSKEIESSLIAVFSPPDNLNQYKSFLMHDAQGVLLHSSSPSRLEWALFKRIWLQVSLLCMVIPITSPISCIRNEPGRSLIPGFEDCQSKTLQPVAAVVFSASLDQLDHSCHAAISLMLKLNRHFALNEILRISSLPPEFNDIVANPGESLFVASYESQTCSDLSMHLRARVLHKEQQNACTAKNNAQLPFQAFVGQTITVPLNNSFTCKFQCAESLLFVPVNPNCDKQILMRSEMCPLPILDNLKSASIPIKPTIKSIALAFTSDSHGHFENTPRLVCLPFLFMRFSSVGRRRRRRKEGTHTAFFLPRPFFFFQQ